MTPRQRVQFAMGHRAPDRVPVMCQLALGHYFLHSRHAPADIWFDSDLLAQTLRDFCLRYEFDGVLVNLPGRPADWRDRIERREADAEGERLTWRSGLVTRCPPDDNPHTFTADGGPLGRADYARTDPDDPAVFRTDGYVWNTWHAPELFDLPDLSALAETSAWPDWTTASLRRTRALLPDHSVHAEVFSPFTHLMELFGYDQALMALVDAPDLCLALLDRLASVAAAQVTLCAACHADAVLISSAFAGAGFISRGMYQRFVLPFESRLAAAAHACALPVYTHTCGAIGDRLDLLAESGIDGIDTLDPPPLGTVELHEAKASFGQRLFLKGNLDAVNEMLRADDGAFRQAVLDRLRIGKVGSGYILSSACSVAPGVKPERLRLMVELAREYGRYE
ncbi:MAG: methylcobalamin:coenzyme M methyltransferase [Planctomycetes bacterium ADurb.Bin126]|nr:MAG: methylcobalamin:coenzyme M methyltransferase [Planctomycetes bacterium ADurb.Bin126]HOD80923.1 uroporphyrinogen decarboxylase family protein [Phycisphaerae bacterium]HQL75062.1 uroporphyrinogen decarboxylase family protein [Phycisphaerae bacterium]